MNDVPTYVCPGCYVKDNEDFSQEYCNMCPTKTFINKTIKDQRRIKTNEHEGV
ncbi:MAG: hypothetical protein IKR19_07645 [Acholeplasmatales bacterium]|nr:hypothetical protein [Acholeplasmatales bacterium]